MRRRTKRREYQGWSIWAVIGTMDMPEALEKISEGDENSDNDNSFDFYDFSDSYSDCEKSEAYQRARKHRNALKKIAKPAYRMAKQNGVPTMHPHKFKRELERYLLAEKIERNADYDFRIQMAEAEQNAELYHSVHYAEVNDKRLTLKQQLVEAVSELDNAYEKYIEATEKLKQAQRIAGGLLEAYSAFLKAEGLE